MYKIGIIGTRDSILGFMAIGFSVHDVRNDSEAAETLHELARSGEYAVIFITEEFATVISDDIAIYKDSLLPTVTVIPGTDGGNGYGMADIRNAVERAVGADILLKNED